MGTISSIAQSTVPMNHPVLISAALSPITAVEPAFDPWPAAAILAVADTGSPRQHGLTNSQIRPHVLTAFIAPPKPPSSPRCHPLHRASLAVLCIVVSAQKQQAARSAQERKKAKDEKHESGGRRKKKQKPKEVKKLMRTGYEEERKN
jgi:hypothetical protein